MLRQVSRRKARWLEAQSRRNMRIHAIRKCGLNRHRNALLFRGPGYLKSMRGTVKVPIKHPDYQFLQSPPVCFPRYTTSP